VGTIVDDEGNPLRGVTVVARAPDGTGGSAVTGAAGSYSIPALPPRTDYAVLADLPCYARADAAPLEMTAGTRTVWNAALTPVLLAPNTFDHLDLDPAARSLLRREVSWIVARLCDPRRTADPGTVENVLGRIGSQPENLARGMRHALLSSLRDRVRPGDRLPRSLLETGEPVLQEIALLLAAESGGWLADPALAQALLSLAASSRAADGVRARVLAIFAAADRFDEIRDLTFWLADHAGPDLARSAGRVAARALALDGGAETLFRSHGGVLREEAAIALAQSSSLAEDRKPEVARELASLLADGALPRDARLRAVGAAAFFVDDPLVRDALLRLLDQDAELWREDGANWLLHAVEVLAASGEPETLGRLARLRDASPPPRAAAIGKILDAGPAPAEEPAPASGRPWP
jgi:hypothetical protein